MMKFSASLLLILILMLSVTSQTTVTINNTTITTTTTTTFSSIYCAAAAESTIVSSQSGCINELTEMSVCLPYISSPPNNYTDEVPPSCCDRYISAESTGSVTCLCHLVKEPCLLGFPVNISRIFALSIVCPFAIPVKIPLNRISLEAQCQAILPNLRPLGSILGPAPSTSPSGSNGSSPSTSTLPADAAHTNSSLPADAAHTNSSTSFDSSPTHTPHRNFGSRFLPKLKRKHFVTYIVCYLVIVLLDVLAFGVYVFSWVHPLLLLFSFWAVNQLMWLVSLSD